MTERQIILIGGAPTVGKSTLAKELARRKGLPYISTDQIRAILRSVANINDFPGLFNASSFSAESFLSGLTAQKIVDLEFEQGEETWIGVKALIEDCDYEWKDGCVIEGVGILPKMVARDYQSKSNVQAVFLFDKSEDRAKEVIFKRGLWDDASQYSDDLKAKEVEWVSLYSEKLIQQARKYAFPMIEVHKNESDIANVMAVLS